MIELRTLGSVGLLDHEGRDLPAALAQPKRLALFTYLAVARPQRLHRRDELLPLFWPDLDESHARDALNQALRFLRQTLGDDTLTGRGTDAIGIDPARVWCDAVAFRLGLEEGRPAEALELYRGPFLPGFFVEGAGGFEAWLERERSLLLEAAAGGARRLADQHEAGGALTLAITWSRRAVELAPDDERALRRLLHFHVQAGDQAGGIRTYEEFARRLEREYGCEPAAETRQLADKLRAGKPKPAETKSNGGVTERYRIERPLGAGGMATVYLARDLKHKRDVALKVLRPDITESLTRERFVREIRIAGRLQHPNIVPLFDSGEADGQLFYTMPHVQGESLRERLTRAGPFTINEAVNVLREVAAALVHAHEEGVIHRDIKPENILLIDRRAVVTDFGIARAAHAARTPAGEVEPTLTRSNTSLGTPAYMAPEQVAGNPEIDHRCDVYALGVVGYEMLSGRPPFSGATPQDVLTAVLVQPPAPLTSRRAEVPARLAGLIMRCLEKQSGNRPQSARELLTALDAVTPGSEAPGGVAVRTRTALRYGLGGITVAAVAVAVAVAFSATRFQPVEVSSTRILVATTEVAQSPTISPDGKLVAYLLRPLTGRGTGSRLLVRQIDGTGEIELAPEFARHGRSRWSPDGTSLFFVLPITPDTQAVYVVPYVGGPSRQVIGKTRQILDPIWHPDGKRILYSSRRRLWLQSVEGGEPVEVSADTGWFRHMDISHDGARLAYTGGSPSRRVARQSIWTVPLAGGTPVRLTDTTSNSWNPLWAPDGRSLLYLSDATGVADVYQQRVSEKGEPIGAAIRSTTGLDADQLSMDQSGRRLIFARLRTLTPIGAATIPPEGEISLSDFRLVTRQQEAVQWPDLSPDGQWLAYDSELSGDANLYKVPVNEGEPIRLTNHPSSDFMPRWSPDGRELAYYRIGSGEQRDIRIVSADGRNDRAVTSEPGVHLGPAWAPTGDALVFISNDTLAVVTRQTDGSWSKRRVLAETAPAGFARWSPDGQWIAYVSPRGALHLIPPAGGLPRTLVEGSALGGVASYPVWSADSRTVFLGINHRPGPGYSCWAVPLSGESPRRLLTVEGVSGGIFATDGRTIYLPLRQEQGDLGILELRW